MTKTAETTITETTEREYNPWEDMRIITVPKRYKGDMRRHVFVNGRPFNIKTGVSVEVPYPVYNVLMNSIEQRANYECMVDQLERESVKNV